MASDSNESRGFWGGISRRGKLIIIVDLMVLGVLAVLGGLYFLRSQPDSRARNVATPMPSTAVSTPPSPPFQTPYGFAWIVAACGGPMLLDDLPESPLPRAKDSAVCFAPEGGATIGIGVYSERAELDADVAGLPGAHRQSTRVDDEGNSWLFLVEGDDPAPLGPLEEYGFRAVR